MTYDNWGDNLLEMFLEKYTYEVKEQYENTIHLT